MMKTSKQSLDILVEQFKYYRYNVGNIKVLLDGQNINLDIELSGDTGKRVFNIVLHDLF
ncbi:hypothetical protein OMAG_001079 [Candidatus Omnitrophus magneticus]|uniref:Uncharacterized protein n=1 Tax=Candidatus Omnitrophus magneticus TaxID=1609969 RepID=A0A0F0CU33_9BACT|nr:hypothetical protein OMAG_001079 [Candidatus Omnitrophus magneticus]